MSRHKWDKSYPAGKINSRFGNVFAGSTLHPIGRRLGRSSVRLSSSARNLQYVLQPLSPGIRDNVPSHLISGFCKNSDDSDPVYTFIWPRSEISSAAGEAQATLSAAFCRTLTIRFLSHGICGFLHNQGMISALAMSVYPCLSTPDCCRLTRSVLYSGSKGHAGSRRLALTDELNCHAWGLGRPAEYASLCHVQVIKFWTSPQLAVQV